MSQETFILILTSTGAFVTSIALLFSILQALRKRNAEEKFLIRLNEIDVDDARRNFDTLLEALEHNLNKIENDNSLHGTYFEYLSKFEELSKSMEKSDRKYILEGLHQPTDIGRLKYMNKLFNESDYKKNITNK